MAHSRNRSLLRGVLLCFAAVMVGPLGACAVFQRVVSVSPLEEGPIQTAWKTETFPLPTRVMSSVKRVPKRPAKAGQFLGKPERVARATVPPLPVAKPAGVMRQPELTPVAPPTSKPSVSPEVVAACGAKDVPCQEQLTRLLEDQSRSWVAVGPTEDESRSGVRIIAFRVLMARLTCTELIQGLHEAESILAEGTAQPPGIEADARSMSVQLLTRVVRGELESIIKQRC
jgi:hypothetical protein